MFCHANMQLANEPNFGGNSQLRYGQFTRLYLTDPMISQRKRGGEIAVWLLETEFKWGCKKATTTNIRSQVVI